MPLLVDPLKVSPTGAFEGLAIRKPGSATSGALASAALGAGVFSGVAFAAGGFVAAFGLAGAGVGAGLDSLLDTDQLGMTTGLDLPTGVD